MDMTTSFSMRRLVCLVACVGALVTPARGQSGPVRLKGKRYVDGHEVRVHCSASGSDGVNTWRRVGAGVRRLDLVPSCPLASDLAGVDFSGREDPIVAFDIPRSRAVVVATASGAVRGALSGELRRKPDDTVSSEHGTLVYQRGSVLFVGEYLARCDEASGCGP